LLTSFEENKESSRCAGKIRGKNTLKCVKNSLCEAYALLEENVKVLKNVKGKGSIIWQLFVKKRKVIL